MKAVRRLSRLFLADDHEDARAGLRNILSRARGFAIVGEASNGREALERIKRLKPDVLLVDVHMPGLDGLAVTRAVGHASPSTRVVIVTMDAAPSRQLAALRAGADAYVLEGGPPRLLLDVVRQALDGQTVLQPELAMYLWGNLQSGDDGWRIDFSEPPTAFEREIVRMCCDGHANAEICRILELNQVGFLKAMRHLLAKLGVAVRS